MLALIDIDLVVCDIYFHFVCIDSCSALNRGGAYFHVCMMAGNPEFYYMTIKNCYSNERVIYTDGDFASTMTYTNCNFTKCFQFRNYHSDGVFLFCNFNTNVKYSTFDCNEAYSSLVSYEQSNDGNSITGITEKCNFVHNNFSDNPLILITRQQYVFEHTIIKDNSANEYIFGTSNSGTLMISNCILQEFRTSGFVVIDCIIGSSANHYTTHPLNFYKTLGCYADIPYYKSNKIKTNNKRPVSFIRFLRY